MDTPSVQHFIPTPCNMHLFALEANHFEKSSKYNSHGSCYDEGTVAIGNLRRNRIAAGAAAKYLKS